MRDPLDVQSIVDWLIDGIKAPDGHPHETLLAPLCERMLARGLPVQRVALFVRPLHPNVAGRSFYWHRGQSDIDAVERGHAFMSTETVRNSPVRVVMETGQTVRRRLSEPGVSHDFPVIDDLRGEGLTDYLMLPLVFLDGEFHAFSVATDAIGGFRDEHIAAFERITPAVARIVEILSWRRKAGNILDAYLGPHAGAKVLAGRIRRGDTEKLRAVIWFCDLRESTSLADAIGAEAFLALLNDYFDAALGPVLERGGQVLSFIGDAALAIFPIPDDDAPGAAKRAVDAAREAIARMHELNQRREGDAGMPLAFGIGLHIGDFLYGNVGTPGRITFTVVGPAANEAARIESLCKKLGTSPLVSEAVARHVAIPWRSLGSHALRGVGHPIELFTFA